jgi:hypothetical protein
LHQLEPIYQFLLLLPGKQEILGALVDSRRMHGYFPAFVGTSGKRRQDKA